MPTVTHLNRLSRRIIRMSSNGPGGKGRLREYELTALLRRAESPNADQVGAIRRKLAEMKGDGLMESLGDCELLWSPTAKGLRALGGGK